MRYLQTDKLKESLTDHFAGFLNSYAMVFFSKDRLFAGILILVTFFDPVAGLSGLVSVLSANLVSGILGLNRFNVRSGFYGFNALLVGLGIGLYYQLTLELVILLVFSSLLTLFITVLLEGVIGKYKLPYLTIPFLLTFWLVTLAARYYAELHISERGVYQINELYSLGGKRMLQLNDWFSTLPLAPSIVTYFKSLSAILFQYHLFTGMLVAAGLLWYSRIAFLLSLTGFYSAYLFYMVIGANFNELNYSFIGFNYILTAIAIGGFYIVSSRTSFLWVILLTPLISILVTSTSVILGTFQLSTYSLPFNLTVLLFLYTLKFRDNRQTGLHLVSLQEYSPEKNLYTQRNNETRFPESSYYPFSLPVMGEWKVTQGHSGEFTHREGWRHAWDLEIADDKGSVFSGKGLMPGDYYCYEKPVVASANGWVEEILDNIPDNEIGQVNLQQNWGNTIIIRHSDTLYTKICHLKKGSFKVKKGDSVKKGEAVALCGNSGRSPVPHVHFQVQSTPFIGSLTIDYPLSQYLLNTEKGYEIKSFSRPVTGDIVSNLNPNSCLGKAFDFVPGQTIEFSVSADGCVPSVIRWDVMADIYNRTYIQCRQSGSKAYFFSNSDIFYFTWFEGNKKSLLFAFYLGAYKIAKGYYRNLTIRDIYPVKVCGNGLFKMLQDFVAPFFLFLHNEYEMCYCSMEDELEQRSIKMKSSARKQICKRSSSMAEFEFLIDNDRVEKFVITEGKHITTAIRSINPQNF
ncbi:MAG TPA: urea transporter [Bacteroidales bacterium]|nr:urea transporter [Bacteroidales bacterium]